MTTTQELAPLASGTRLDAYRIESLLQRERFSYSYLARDGAGTQLVIREFLPAEFVVREGDAVQPREAEDRTALRFWLRSFLDKAAALERLGHPGLVRVLRHFEANGTGYYVTEAVAGESLAAILEREPTLSEAQLRRLLQPLLGGLELAHAAGLLHRDIRPATLLVRGDDSALLTDFGVLRAPIRMKARTVMSAADPAYAAPEEFSLSGPHGPWTDLYALGAVAYRVIAGAPPPDARARRGGAGALSTAQAARVRCSETLLEAIDAALALEPAARPQTVPAWRARLEPQAAAAAQAAPAAAAAPPPQRSPHRRAPPLWVLLLAVGGVLAAGVAYLSSRPQPPAVAAAREVAAPLPAAAVPANMARPVPPPAAPGATAPAPAGTRAGLDQLAEQLLSKEKKAQEARDQQQALQAQRDEEERNKKPAAAAAGTAPAPPSEAEQAAAAKAKQLEAEVERLRAEQAAQQQAEALRHKAEEDAAAQAAAQRKAEQERQAKIVARARASCRIPAPDLSSAGNLTYETAQSVAGAEKAGNGAIRLPPVTLSDGSTAVFEVTPDSCARMVQ